MKMFMKWLGIIALAVVFGLFIAGCRNVTNDDDEDKIPKNAIELTTNVWSNGAVTEGGEQWFKFTATASTQYLHITSGTMNNMNVRLYNNKGDALGDAIGLLIWGNPTENIHFMVTNGQEYYVRITSGQSPLSQSSKTGTYRIAFNTVQFRPGTFDQAVSLTAGTWESGNILDGGEQWFKFTATASTQYLHIASGTMNNMNVRLYNNKGDALGDAIGLLIWGNPTENIHFMVTNGQEYYVRITSGQSPLSQSSKTGTYQIAFNASTTAPD